MSVQAQYIHFQKVIWHFGQISASKGFDAEYPQFVQIQIDWVVFILASFVVGMYKINDFECKFLLHEMETVLFMNLHINSYHIAARQLYGLKLLQLFPR